MRRQPATAVRSILLVLALTLIAATGPAGIPAGAADPDTLVYALISTGTDKIPAFTTTGEDTDIMAELRLPDAGGCQDVEDRSRSRQRLHGQRRWQDLDVHVREGASSGSRATGSSRAPTSPSRGTSTRTPPMGRSGKTQASAVDSVTCPDPYTAVFHLETPFLGFIWNVANVEPSTGWVMSKAAWDKLGRAGYEKTPIGTGPFMVKSLNPSQDVVLVRNPDYWGRKPAIDEIDFSVIADSQTAALAVKAGAVDITNVRPISRRDRVSEHARRQGDREDGVQDRLPRDEDYGQAVRRRERPPSDAVRDRLRGAASRGPPRLRYRGVLRHHDGRHDRV